MAPATLHRPADDLAPPPPESGIKEIKTYKMAERSDRLDFEIRSHKVRPPVTTPHRHEFFQIEANVCGEAHHVICGQRRSYPARSLIFILPYRVHYAAHELGDPEYYVINFASNFLRQDLTLSPLDIEAASTVEYPELIPFLYEGSVDFVFSEQEFAYVSSILDRLQELQKHRTLGTMERIRGALLEIIGFTVERHATALQALSDSRAFMKGRSDALARVMAFIDDSLSRNVSLNDVASATFLSPNYVSQLLKKQTGMAFVEWLTARRMEQAQHLLAHTVERVSKIANSVGFEDEAYFTRRFRQRFNLSPSEYRKAMRSALGLPSCTL
jgi:AraC-like DNA-binding protein